MSIRPYLAGARIPSSLATLRRDTKGAALLEFALVALPLFGIIIAVCQITTTFFAQQALDTASEKAARQLMTGEAQKAGMTATQFKNLLCTKLPSFMKCANVMIEVRTATSFSGLDMSMPTITYNASGDPTNTFQFSPGTAGQITIARVMYVWNVQSGPLGFDISTMTGSRRLLVATNVFQAEPYI